ncbi:hypothetical protein J7I44_13855 [Frateuria sp. MAH-13]|jgi:hypothetical protein|uniref:Uncharacterized protein n=1 Tax=Frateuria flava TaxID=2821489 RepID=A0ABS4DR20_9GAMM|nr:hypothetical protein [Frateuria flava]MBP1475393.1 hypothetical protein [Frateuria flava]
MEFDSIRPILSGLTGGAIATWLLSRWARSLPRGYRSKSREQLLREHRVAVYAANGLFMAGILLSLAMYKLGGYASNDPWPLAMGFGAASAAPLLALAIIPALTGRSIREAYVAFAWGQGSPIWATYGILGVGLLALAWGLAKLGT